MSRILVLGIPRPGLGCLVKVLNEQPDLTGLINVSVDVSGGFSFDLGDLPGFLPVTHNTPLLVQTPPESEAYERMPRETKLFSRRVTSTKPPTTALL